MSHSSKAATTTKTKRGKSGVSPYLASEMSSSCKHGLFGSSSTCHTSLCPCLGRVRGSAAAVQRGVRAPGRCRAVALGQASPGCPGSTDIVAENEIIAPGFQAVRALYFQLKSNIPALREYFSKLTI